MACTPPYSIFHLNIITNHTRTKGMGAGADDIQYLRSTLVKIALNVNSAQITNNFTVRWKGI